MVFIAQLVSQLLMLVVAIDTANILGIATYDGNSHWLVMKSVLQSLEEAGHRITVITPYSSVSDTNFTVVDVSKILPLRTNAFNFDHLSKEYYNPLKTFHTLPNLSLRQCDKAHTFPEVHEILTHGQKFDLVISETFGADCDAVFAHILKVPLISVITSTLLPWANARVGNPENPSYISNIMLPYSDRMTFQQRFVNVFYCLYTAMTTWYYNRVTTDLNRKHFGNRIPPVEEILRETSLVFVNSHFSIDVARPLMPNIIEIGGIHLKSIKPLPKDLAHFLDNSKHGAIYFSLGSILRASSLPNSTLNAIKEAFAELEFNILWKFEDENLNVSSNVLIRRWFPQRDILAHKSIKLVIMHGGLMGIYETVDIGIPVIGLPLFFDQQRNIKNLESKGAALRLEINKITKNYLLENIRRIIGDKRFEKRAQGLSKRFHDRLVHPSKAVVYWTEYVINHNAAFYLKSSVTDLYWFQVINLDVIISVMLIIFIGYCSFKKINLLLRNFNQKLVPKTRTILDNKIFNDGMQKNRIYEKGILKNGVHLKIN